MRGGKGTFHCAIQGLSQRHLHADVTSCEPDVLVSIDAPSVEPNDPQYPQQWNLGDIQMPTAWATGAFGNATIRTCVIDTGVDYTHPDLISNLWVNQKEMNGPGANAANGYRNGIDDDGNGKNLVLTSLFESDTPRPSQQMLVYMAYLKQNCIV